MNAEQRAARDSFAALLRHSAEADANYDLLTESHGGRIISTDIARFLETRYRDTPAGRPRDLAGVGSGLAVCAGPIAKGNRESEWSARCEVYGRRVGRRQTHALQGAELADIAWDGTLKGYRWACEMIDLALDHGWRVQIAYVLRDIELALYGAIERAKKEGRGVPLRTLPGNHRAVQRSVLRLLRRYENHPRVVFLLLHNMGAETIHGKSLVIRVAELAPKGALHYSKRHEEYYAEAAGEIEALNPVAG